MIVFTAFCFDFKFILDVFYCFVVKPVNSCILVGSYNYIVYTHFTKQSIPFHTIYILRKHFNLTLEG